MNLVDRVKNILLQPKQEWLVIAAEVTDVKTLYTSYICILAAIPAVAAFIGYSLIGMTIPFFGTWRVPIASGLAHLLISYVLSLAACYVLALIIDALAPTFSGVKNFIQALKVAAYGSTAGWLAGIFSIIPALGILGILGLYSIYLIYTGLPRLMGAPEGKAAGYTAVVIICAIVLFIVVGAVGRVFMPMPGLGPLIQPN